MNYLNFRELREKIGGRSRSSIYRDVERGYLPAPYKLGHQLYWREDEIERAVEEKRISPRKPRRTFP